MGKSSRLDGSAELIKLVEKLFSRRAESVSEVLFEHFIQEATRASLFLRCLNLFAARRLRLALGSDH